MAVNFAQSKAKAEELINATPSWNDGSEYYLRKNRYLRVSVSPTKDEVVGEFVINFSRPLPQLNTSFGKAYAVTLKNGNDNDVYAVILDKRYPIRLMEINKLVGQRIESFTNIVASQFITTSVSKGKVCAVIIEMPRGSTLAEYIKKNGKLSEEYIAKIVVPAINNVIVILSGLGVVHGKINANNVYIEDSGHITVGECVSESCGYSQPLIYETVNRAAAMPYGKGVGNMLVDYYALGVLVAILLRGVNPLEGVSEEEILDKKLEEGTYRIVTYGMDMSVRMLDLMRGVLNERTPDAWGPMQMNEWIRGRRFNLLPPADNSDSGRSIFFNGKKYLNRKHLVHALYGSWEEAKKFIKKDAIIKWVDRGANSRDLSESLEMLIARYGRERERSGFNKDDELLAQYILLLDPTGPIRLRDFSANIDGLGLTLAHGFAANSRHCIEAVENIILYNIVSIIPSSTKELSQQNIQDALFLLNRCIDLLRKRDMGFGIERCLYELNPSLPCQGHAVIEESIFTKEELLKFLDKSENIGGKILDAHTASFLTEKMEMQLRVHIPSLGRFPEFATNSHIQALALLSLAQQSAHMGSLHGLTRKVHDSLKNLIDEFHSKTIREEITYNLKKVEKQGYLSQTLKIITDSKYLVRDRIGFKKARSEYQENAIQIVKMGNTSVINNVGYRYGLQLAVIISFFLATVEIISLIIKAF